MNVVRIIRIINFLFSFLGLLFVIPSTVGNGWSMHNTYGAGLLYYCNNDKCAKIDPLPGNTFLSFVFQRNTFLEDLQKQPLEVFCKKSCS